MKQTTLNKIYKIFTSSISVLLLSAICFTISINAAVHTNTTSYNWYFKKNTQNTPPLLPDELCFIKKHKGYYLDENASSSDKVIYLTFDAGYENGNVDKVLDALNRHNAKGAFFILDNLIIRNSALVQKMIDTEHIVANHTAKHPDMSAITDKTLYKKQITSLEKLYKEKFGVDIAPYYRPPQGRFSEQNLEYTKELGYSTIFWSFAYADWDNNNQPNPQKSIEKIMTHTHNGMVILLHPTSETNATIMDELLTKWENQGYRFGTLDELVK